MAALRDHLPLGLCYLAIGVVGSFGHLFLIRIFQRHSLRHVRNRNAYFLHMHLAIANLGVIAGFPFTGWSYIAGRWLFGDMGCQLYAFEGIAFGVASIFFLLLISLDRFYAAYDTYSYADLTRADYKNISYIFWLISITFASLPFFGIGRYTKELSEASCAINWYQPDSNYTTFILLLTTFCYAIPFMIITLCHFWTSRLKKEEQDDGSYVDMLLTSEELNLYPKVFTLVSLIAWTPYALICLQFLVRDPAETSMLLAALPPIFAKMAISVIPFIYGLSSNGMYLEFTRSKIPEKMF